MKPFKSISAAAALFLIGILLVLSISDVEATVYCGDLILSDTTLDTNLDCSGYSGDALTIAANDVTIDLNGFTIMRSNTEYAAIYGSGHSGVTIKNGAVHGFQEGIWLFHSKNIVIQDLSFAGQGDDSIQINHSKDVNISDIQTSLPLPNGGSSVALQYVHNARLQDIVAVGGTLGVLSHESVNFRLSDSSLSHVRYRGVELIKNRRAVIENVVVAGASTCASAIGAVWYGPNEKVYVLDNALSGCDVGVLLEDTGSPGQMHIRGNRISANFDGILLNMLQNSDIKANRVHFAGAGIILLEESLNNRISGNVSTGNAIWDLYHDLSSAPNVWKNNTCVLASGGDVDCP